MKSKQLKKYIGKIVTYRTIWNTFETAMLIEIKGYFATFEKDNVKTQIKIFNIAQIQLEHLKEIGMMDSKKNNILNQVNDSMQLGEFKRETEKLIESFSSIASINKNMYEEMLKQGFNEQQAFRFACDYTLKLMFNNGAK